MEIIASSIAPGFGPESCERALRTHDVSRVAQLVSVFQNQCCFQPLSRVTPEPDGRVFARSERFWRESLRSDRCRAGADSNIRDGSHRHALFRSGGYAEGARGAVSSPLRYAACALACSRPARMAFTRLAWSRSV